MKKACWDIPMPMCCSMPSAMPCWAPPGLATSAGIFPTRAAQYKGISSLLLLAEVRGLLGRKGYRVNNVDATIVAERPKMADHIPVMVANIASAVQVERSAVNVKATTTEGLGFAGRGEGIAAYAACTIVPEA